MFWDERFDPQVRRVTAAINNAYADRHGYSFHGHALAGHYDHWRQIRAAKFGLVLRLLRSGGCPYVLFLDADAHVQPERFPWSLQGLLARIAPGGKSAAERVELVLADDDAHRAPADLNTGVFVARAAALPMQLLAEALDEGSPHPNCRAAKPNADQACLSAVLRFHLGRDLSQYALRSGGRVLVVGHEVLQCSEESAVEAVDFLQGGGGSGVVRRPLFPRCGGGRPPAFAAHHARLAGAGERLRHLARRALLRLRGRDARAAWRALLRSAAAVGSRCRVRGHGPWSAAAPFRISSELPSNVSRSAFELPLNCF